MDCEILLQTSLIDNETFSKRFLDLLYRKSQSLCKPSLSPLPEDEYSSCRDFFQHLENYIIGSDNREIISTGLSKTICGKIFKSREPIYVCRDCSTDETCVFCRICFLNSEHTKHNYEMHISSGGGYCDCGDDEAWKHFPRCNLHCGNTDQSSSLSTVIDNLHDVPDRVQVRFLELSSTILQQFKAVVMRPLCKTDSEARSRELLHELEFIDGHQSSKNDNTIATDDQLCLLLYNNEFHNFDQVINLFKRCLPCSTEQATAFANIVDRDGRCMALISSDRCDVEMKQNDILSRSKAQTSMELLCRVHHPLFLGVQNLLIYSLRWLYEFVDQYPRLRILLCRHLFEEESIEIECDVVESGGKGGVARWKFERSSFIEDIFHNHVELWKAARNICTNFLMTAVFKETYFKKLFVVEMAKNYAIVIHHFAIDDHNAEDSLISLNCQLFTIISFAKFLLEYHDILDKIMKLVYEYVDAYSKPLKHPKMENRCIKHFEKEENDTNKKFDPFERRMRALNDLKFLLTSILTAYAGHKEEIVSIDGMSETPKWTEKGIENFLKYFQTFSDFLALIQDTDTIERVTDHHVEHDPNWKTGIIMMYDSIACITLTGQLLVSNPICWEKAFNIFREQVVKVRIVDLERGFRKTFRLLSYMTTVVENNWPSKYISAIKPIHRFMATMLIDKKYRDLLNITEKDCLLDQALQMVVFASQQAGNMWIRNGSVPYILTQQIKCLTLASEMFDRDLQLIQQIALCIPPDQFFLKCIHKFDLKSYFEGDSCKQSDKKALLQRVEDFLHTLIMTIFFRHRIGVGTDIDRKAIYSHIIFHILCVKPIPHSKLLKKLSPTLQKYPKGNLMEIIDNVADQSLQGQVVIFSAKKSLLTKHFDRYSPYYSIQDRNEAELWVQNSFKRDNVSTAMNPPVPIDLTDDCSSLYDYISNQCFVKLLNLFLSFCISKRNGEFWTDTILDMVLYLIGASLLEDVKTLELPLEKRRPLFIKAATQKSANNIIGNLEILCDKITCDQQLELIKWTIRKWNDVLRIKNFTGDKNPQTAEEMEIETENVQALSQTRVAKADAAKKRREQLMNKMWNMQQKFITENSELLMDNADQSTDMVGVYQHHVFNNQKDCPVPVQSKTIIPSKREMICILCQEPNSEDNGDRPMVLIAGAWRSSVLARHPFLNQPSSQQSQRHTDNRMRTVPSIDSNLYFDELINTVPLPNWNYLVDEYEGNDIDRIVSRSIGPMLDHAVETFITTCGHVMHYDCKTNYMRDMIKQKQTVARTKGVLYPRIYYRCPLCKCVCNIDIPIIKDDCLTLVDGADGVVPIINRSLLKSNMGSRSEIVTPEPAAQQNSFEEWVNVFKLCSMDSQFAAAANGGSGGGSDVRTQIHWWNKLGTHFSNFVKFTSSVRVNDIPTTIDMLLSSLAYRSSLAVKLQPAKLTKETYKNFETIRTSVNVSSLQELVELNYGVMHTLSVWEKIMTKQNLSFFTDIPERHADGLKLLIKAVCKSHQVLSGIDSVYRECQSFCSFIQQMLFDCTAPGFQAAWKELNKVSKVPLFILEVDFTYVLGCLLFMRYMFLSAHTQKTPGETTPVPESGYYSSVGTTMSDTTNTSSNILDEENYYFPKLPEPSSSSLSSPETTGSAGSAATSGHSVGIPPSKDHYQHQLLLMFRNCNYNFYIVRFMYQFVSVQTLLSLKTTNVVDIDFAFSQLQAHSPDLWTPENIDLIYQFQQSLVNTGNRSHLVIRSSPQLTAVEVAVCFSKSVLPFLRCAAMILHEIGSIDDDISSNFAGAYCCDTEFNCLIRALKLDFVPFTDTVLPSHISIHLKMIDDYQSDEMKTIWNTTLPHIIPEALPKLIDLPNEFTDIITMGLERGCSLSQQATGTVSEMSICLICGITVCLSGYCCRRIEESSTPAISGAQIHARQCHSGYALFLSTRSSKVIVLFYQARWQIHLDPIYLDKYGENDIDLKRGNPLFLNLEAYGKLERSWLNHSVGCIVNDAFFSNDFFV